MNAERWQLHLRLPPHNHRLTRAAAPDLAASHLQLHLSPPQHDRIRARRRTLAAAPQPAATTRSPILPQSPLQRAAASPPNDCYHRRVSPQHSTSARLQPLQHPCSHLAATPPLDTARLQPSPRTSARCCAFKLQAGGRGSPPHLRSPPQAQIRAWCPFASRSIAQSAPGVVWVRVGQ